MSKFRKTWGCQPLLSYLSKYSQLVAALTNTDFQRPSLKLYNRKRGPFLVDAAGVHRIRGYRYELQVKSKERTRLSQCAGTARFAWNWGLACRNERYYKNQGPERFTDAMKQHRLLNALKRTEFPWMYHYSECVPQEALQDL
ncbi:MAG: helix-turn-helix domain-containing protein [Candidatus Hodarchaeota archaeon]